MINENEGPIKETEGSGSQANLSFGGGSEGGRSGVRRIEDGESPIKRASGQSLPTVVPRRACRAFIQRCH